MPKSLVWFIAMGVSTALLNSSTHAQTQKRNFNLNCGLVGSFARYPQHNNLCKWQVFCTDPKTCMRKLAVVPQAVLSPGELEGPPQGVPSSDGLSLSVDAQGSISAGGLNASGAVSGGAAADSGGGASAGGNAGASGGNAGVGGGLGTNGL